MIYTNGPCMYVHISPWHPPTRQCRVGFEVDALHSWGKTVYNFFFNLFHIWWAKFSHEHVYVPMEYDTRCAFGEDVGTVIQHQDIVYINKVVLDLIQQCEIPDINMVCVCFWLSGRRHHIRTHVIFI